MAKRYIPSHCNDELLPWFIVKTVKKVYKNTKKS